MLRREFLRRSLAAMLSAGALAGLETLAAHAVAGEATPASGRALRRLAAELSGPLIVPSSASYDAARRVFNTRFDRIFPAAIAYCTNAPDVQACLRWARRERVPIAVRNGGHSAAGYSTTHGLIIDVSRMNHVSADVAAGRVIIGAGALQGAIYPSLVRRGLTIPGGTCPGVGISGLTLGGGVGYLTNLLGTASDSLLGVDLVTAEGRLVRCDDRRLPALFWALRGAGGGNFGVVTALVFRPFPVHRATVAVLEWDLRDARRLVDAWQRWAMETGDRLSTTCEASTHATASSAQAATITVSVQFAGSEGDLTRVLEPLIRATAARPRRRLVRDAPYAEVVAFWLSREAPASERATVKNKTHFANGPLPPDATDALVGALESRQAADMLTSPGGFWIQALGGRYARVGKETTAFVHRDARILIQYLTKWKPTDSNVVVRENLRWIDALYTAMRPFVSGGAYQNFMDPDLRTWPRAYYGANLERLVRIKRAVDPTNLFRFAQSIPTRM
jgi:FAD/FMN-containing dehydrogenase